MTVKIQTEQGLIELSNEVIATVVGGAATDNYGVVGMASRNHIRDNLNERLIFVPVSPSGTGNTFNELTNSAFSLKRASPISTIALKS